LVGVLVLAAPSGIAGAAEWGGITPGVSTRENVSERYGQPSRESRQALEGYETIQWVYEGARAPVGLKRMVVDFGLLTAQGYRTNVVRSFLLEPKPGVFQRRTVINGWGAPDGVSIQDGHQVFFYKSGLVVYFPERGADATSMLFTPPQTEPPKPASR
jgi:hypothetical protein